MKDYRNYRWFFTSTGALVVGGKNAKQNDKLVSETLRLRKDYVIMHTASPGSPFCVIVKERDKLKKEDLKECAIFTGCFSQDWKRGKKMSEIHIFRSMQLSKAELKEGSWRVSGDVEKVKVPLKLSLVEQKGVLRAVPQDDPKKYTYICPGSIDKKDLLDEMKKFGKFKEEEILAALPAGGIKICKS